jgi:hypothetical protein
MDRPREPPMPSAPLAHFFCRFRDFLGRSGTGYWWASLPHIRALNQAFTAGFRTLAKRLTPTVTPALMGLSQAPPDRVDARPDG